jgi:tripartite motif-containing protein 2/3
VPFSTAIKRMSEILLYKASQCVRTLNRAVDSVQVEQDQLDANVDRILDEINASFQV